MAKRKRLTPAQAGFLTGSALPEDAPARPPIAQVAGEAAAVAALGTLSDEWTAARDEGRLVVMLPVDHVQDHHLVRDRAILDDEALNSLKQSLMARGQQTPIEVQALAKGQYGLISGWRRLTALRQLHAETGEARFDTVQALIRRPEDLAASYVAMVEENEIRADLSFYERARVVLKSLEAGVFDSEKSALQTLFSTGSYARRSKIKSFLPVVRALDGALRFPQRMTERTGLALSKALAAGDADLPMRLQTALGAAAPVDAEAETACLIAALAQEKPAKTPKSEPKQTKSEAADVILSFDPNARRIVLRGAGVSPALARDLHQWLKSRS